MFEVTFIREAVGGICKGVMLDRQIEVVEALTELDALARIGQMFSNDDYYIHILEVKEA